MRRAAATLLVLTCLIPLTGCPINPQPAEAVLQGTWELTGDVVAENVSELLITFNERGVITRITYRFGAATIVIDDESFIQSSSNVDGDQVTIVATWLGGNNLFFEGTLNADETRIDGTTSYILVIGSIDIEVPTGAATLTKR